MKIWRPHYLVSMFISMQTFVAVCFLDCLQVLHCRSNWKRLSPAIWFCSVFVLFFMALRRWCFYDDRACFVLWMYSYSKASSPVSTREGLRIQVNSLREKNCDDHGLFFIARGLKRTLNTQLKIYVNKYRENCVCLSSVVYMQASHSHSNVKKKTVCN